MPRPADYAYDERTGRYRGPDGRFLSRLEIRAELDRALQGIERETRALAEAYRAREIDLRTFEVGMRSAIKDVHLVSAALARGGWAQMGNAEYGQVGGLVGRQYVFLDRFLGDVRSGKQSTDGFFLQRATMYIRAGRRAYHDAERSVMRARGFTEERNDLHPAEHCRGPGSCTEQAERGWVPIGSLTPVGSRLCLSNCICSLAYR